MTDCHGCKGAAKRMLIEGVDSTCPVCGTVFTTDAEVIEERLREAVGARSTGARPDDAASAAARPAEAPAREARASGPRSSAKRGSDVRSLLSLSAEDAAQVRKTMDIDAQWTRIRVVVEALLRWEHTIEINENSARSGTNGSNWLRGVIGLVSADMLKERPELRAFAEAPLVIGPGHTGSIGDSSNAMPDFKAIPVNADTIVRFSALSPRASATAVAVRNDGQGDRLVARVLRDGHLPVSLGLEQRVGLEIAPPEVRQNWWHELARGNRGALLTGSKLYGWEALCALEREWNAVESAKRTG